MEHVVHRRDRQTVDERRVAGLAAGGHAIDDTGAAGEAVGAAEVGLVLGAMYRGQLGVVDERLPPGPPHLGLIDGRRADQDHFGLDVHGGLDVTVLERRIEARVQHDVGIASPQHDDLRHEMRGHVRAAAEPRVRQLELALVDLRPERAPLGHAQPRRQTRSPRHLFLRRCRLFRRFFRRLHRWRRWQCAEKPVPPGMPRQRARSATATTNPAQAAGCRRGYREQRRPQQIVGPHLSAPALFPRQARALSTSRPCCLVALLAFELEALELALPHSSRCRRFSRGTHAATR
mmetsp:Transcript_6201/g.17309  ORF Transcript_6201/g.17309 Transcript_6201/m.17309 type:complete len:290 (+) Transcript_6201:1312-2181(+)